MRILGCVDVATRIPDIGHLDDTQSAAQVGRPRGLVTGLSQHCGEVRRAQVLPSVGDEHRGLDVTVRRDRREEAGNGCGTMRCIACQQDDDRLMDAPDDGGDGTRWPLERDLVANDGDSGIGVRLISDVQRCRADDDDTRRRLRLHRERCGDAGGQEAATVSAAPRELARQSACATTREHNDGVADRRRATRVLLMRLHGAISPDLPLLVVALEEEATHLHVSGLPILVTGVGKVNAAMAVAQTLSQHSPRAVVNIGTAGALHDGLAGTHVIGRVIQHDLDGAAIHALTGIHASPALDVAAEGLTLATGDVFVSDPSTRARLAELAHLVDMEGYAVARAASAALIPVTLVKQVSDTADDRAGRSWKESVEACAVELGIWVRTVLLAD